MGTPKTLPESAPNATPPRRVEVYGPVGDAAYAEDGTDLTLIHAALERTPGERLRYLEGAIASLEQLRRAARRP